MACEQLFVDSLLVAGPQGALVSLPLSDALEAVRQKATEPPCRLNSALCVAIRDLGGLPGPPVGGGELADEVLVMAGPVEGGQLQEDVLGVGRR